MVGPATMGLPGFSAGGGMAVAPASSATAHGGSIGSFHFAPKSASPVQLALIAAAVLGAWLLLRR